MTSCDIQEELLSAWGQLAAFICTEMFTDYVLLNLHFLRNPLKRMVRTSRSVARAVIFYPAPQDSVYLWLNLFPTGFLPLMSFATESVFLNVLWKSLQNLARI